MSCASEGERERKRFGSNPPGSVTAAASPGPTGDASSALLALPEGTTFSALLGQGARLSTRPRLTHFQSCGVGASNLVRTETNMAKAEEPAGAQPGVEVQACQLQGPCFYNPEVSSRSCPSASTLSFAVRTPHHLGHAVWKWSDRETGKLKSGLSKKTWDMCFTLMYH